MLLASLRVYTDADAPAIPRHLPTSLLTAPPHAQSRSIVESPGSSLGAGLASDSPTASPANYSPRNAAVDTPRDSYQPPHDNSTNSVFQEPAHYVLPTTSNSLLDHSIGLASSPALRDRSHHSGSLDNSRAQETSTAAVLSPSSQQYDRGSLSQADPGLSLVFSPTPQQVPGDQLHSSTEGPGPRYNGRYNSRPASSHARPGISGLAFAPNHHRPSPVQLQASYESRTEPNMSESPSTAESSLNTIYSASDLRAASPAHSRHSSITSNSATRRPSSTRSTLEDSIPLPNLSSSLQHRVSSPRAPQADLSVSLPYSTHHTAPWSSPQHTPVPSPRRTAPSTQSTPGHYAAQPSSQRQPQRSLRSPTVTGSPTRTQDRRLASPPRSHQYSPSSAHSSLPSAASPISDAPASRNASSASLHSDPLPSPLTARILADQQISGAVLFLMYAHRVLHDCTSVCTSFLSG